MASESHGKEAPDLMEMLSELYGIRNHLEDAGMPKKPGNCDAEAWVTEPLTSAYISLNAAIEGFEAHFEAHPYDWKGASDGKPSEQDYPEPWEDSNEHCPACGRFLIISREGKLFCNCGWKEETSDGKS